MCYGSMVVFPNIMGEDRLTMDQVEHLMPATRQPPGRRFITAHNALMNPSGVRISSDVETLDNKGKTQSSLSVEVPQCFEGRVMIYRFI